MVDPAHIIKMTHNSSVNFQSAFEAALNAAQQIIGAEKIILLAIRPTAG